MKKAVLTTLFLVAVFFANVAVSATRQWAIDYIALYNCGAVKDYFDDTVNHIIWAPCGMYQGYTPAQVSEKNLGAQNTCNNTNPINGATGNKFQQETDYQSQGSLPLSFQRYYNSSSEQQSAIGAHWQATYFDKLSIVSNVIQAQRASGEIYQFVWKNNRFTADADVDIKIQVLPNSLWQLSLADQSIETYSPDGKLRTRQSASGLTQTLKYDTLGRLIQVSDPLGRSLNFNYLTSTATARIAFIQLPDQSEIHYHYDSNGNLDQVIYPDNTPLDRSDNPQKTYHYENTQFPGALTGITDELGNRFASWSYDAQGRAIASEHAGGVERMTLIFNADGSTSITDPENTTRRYHFQNILGMMKDSGHDQPGGAGCNAASSKLSYDAKGNVASRTDFNGNRTDYTYDLTRNLETSRTEGLTATGAATPATRTITLAWHPDFRLPVQITNANQQTRYTYNSQGDITQKTVTDTAANTSRSWSTAYTYSTVPGVLLKKVEDGPRTDVPDLTTYDYYPVDAVCTGGNLGCRGQLKQITNALGHITQLTRYTAHSQLAELIDPNGLVMAMSYDLRQRLTSFDAGGETTTYSYDPAGQLIRVIPPDGTYLAYSYDAAHRLIKVQDNLGNTLSYTLDARGNRLKEDLIDPNGQLTRTQSRVYDTLSRLKNRVLPQ